MPQDETTPKPSSISYESAGVSIEKGDEAVELLSPLAKSTYNKNVLAGVGGFAALYELTRDEYRNPVLVSATDGIGTKLELAKIQKRFDTVGYDLVAMVLDDLACTGAKPLFMLDYVSVGKLNPKVVEELVGGIAKAAKECGCVLIGGETAEHPGVSKEDDIDVAGFAVGVVEKDLMWGSHRVKVGDALIGLESPNARSNGFSLIRTVFAEPLEKIQRGENMEPIHWDPRGRNLLQILLEPSVLYTPVLRDCVVRTGIHAAAHITGGGLLGNLKRVIPPGLTAEVIRHSWSIPEIFVAIQRSASIDWREMDRVFNLGVGMVLVVASGSESNTIQRLEELGVRGYLIGEVVGTGSKEHGARWR